MSTKPGDWWQKSFNPWEGCQRISEACDNCWALAMMERFKKPPFTLFLPGHKRWDRVRRDYCHTRYFVCSLSDFFLDHIPVEMYEAAFDLFEANPRHTFILLTKRPHNAVGLLDRSKIVRWPPNVWLGITAENQQRFDERIVHLEKIPTAVKFVHCEPLLGPIRLGDAADWLDWVVVGGENGPGARPMHPKWAADLRDECQAAGIPFWFKGHGAWKEALSFDRNNPPGYMPVRWRWLNIKGGFGFHGDDVVAMRPTKNAGRILYGHEWNELPRSEP